MTKSRSLFPRFFSWSLVAATACVMPFAGQLGTRTLARDLPTLKQLQPRPQHLRVDLPADITEGQPVTLRLAWKDIPPATQVHPVTLQVKYSAVDYQGKAMALPQPITLGSTHQQQTLLFRQSGVQTLEVVDEAGTVWFTQQVTVKPFPASVFPRHQARYPALSDRPEDYRIWVNLHYDPKQQPQQRQYAQITYRGQILERLLVSSGAPGHDTPLGQFKVGFKDYYPRSARYDDTPMPFWSAINMNGNEGEYGFHSLEDGGYLYLLGRPASHGCIRMSRLPSVETDAKTGQSYWGDRGGARWVYDRIPKETPVLLFKQPLSSFVFEDYSQYLHKEAQRYLKQKTS